MVQPDVNSAAEIAIKISQLSFAYTRAASPVLKIPCWQVGRGEQVFLQGPSGCGKSTLLNLLSGVLVPSAGDIQLLGQSLTSLSAHQRDRFRARHIGIVFQQFNLIPYLSVQDNIRLAASFSGNPQSEIDELINKLFKSLKLSQKLLSQRADHLSVGQQQRVAIARALVNKPEILVVDEPTSALDSAARDAFMQLLLQVSRENGSTLVFVSHDLSLSSFFDRSISLQELNQVEGTAHAD